MASRDMPHAFTNLYNLLDPTNQFNLSPSSSLTDIRKAYRRRALEVHPDKCNESNAAELFAAVQWAFDILSSEEGRKQHDAVIEAAIVREAKRQRESSRIRSMRQRLEQREAEALASREQQQAFKRQRVDEQQRMQQKSTDFLSRLKEEMRAAEVKQQQQQLLQQAHQTSSFSKSSSVDSTPLHSLQLTWPSAVSHTEPSLRRLFPIEELLLISVKQQRATLVFESDKGVEEALNGLKTNTQLKDLTVEKRRGKAKDEPVNKFNSKNTPSASSVTSHKSTKHSPFTVDDEGEDSDSFEAAVLSGMMKMSKQRQHQQTK